MMMWPSILGLVLLCGAALAQTNTRSCVCGATSQGGDVNVRSCASTTCAVVGVIHAGDCYTHLSSSGVWRQINYRGNTNAWSHGDYLSGPQTCGDGSATACSANLCSSTPTNVRRTCDPLGCGNYGASRSGGTRTHAGTDVACTMNDVVYAPFDGYISREVIPYGDNSCCDTGFSFIGSGAHANIEVWVFYARANTHPYYPSVTYQKGDPIAVHRGLHCGCYSTSMTDHIHFEIRLSGTRIDPASWLCLAPISAEEEEEELDD